MNFHNDLPNVRFRLNMARIHGLINLIFSDTPGLKGTQSFQIEGIQADIFRTIVVFLHATFEDFLRSIARQRINVVNSQEILDKIPLVGVSRSGRAEKFLLGTLITHRGKTVDQLIHESVENYLDKTSFGSIQDVEEVLTQMEVDTAPFKFLYSDLEQMMRRRHRIVHEADFLNPKDTASVNWMIEDSLNLCVWLMAVPIFFAQLGVSVDPADEVQRWFAASWINAIEFAHTVRAENIALLSQPQIEIESLRQGLLRTSEQLKELAALLAGPSKEEIFLIWKKLKTLDDDTNDEQARAKINDWFENRE